MTGHAEEIVEFVILSDNLTPTEITQHIGLEPSRVFGIGERIGRTIKRSKTNKWIIGETVGNGNFESAIAQLLSILDDKRDAINSLPSGTVRRMDIVSCAYSANSSIEISPEHLSEISSLDASIWFDFYYLGDSEDQGEGD